jgi:hypothetical protein
MKTILKYFKNLIGNTLNFVTIQWNYLQASPITWYYPFNSYVEGHWAPLLNILLLLLLQHNYIPTPAVTGVKLAPVLDCRQEHELHIRVEGINPDSNSPVCWAENTGELQIIEVTADRLIEGKEELKNIMTKPKRTYLVLHLSWSSLWKDGFKGTVSQKVGELWVWGVCIGPN